MKIYLTALAVAAFAASLITGSAAFGADPAATPAQETQGNVSFISGGVGEDEAAMMKQAAAGYPLELQFVQKASPRDEFLASVKVRITDRSRNTVLDTVTNGPFLLAKLPNGSYRVEAEYDGVVKTQTVNVGSGKQRGRAMFVWANEANRPVLNGVVGDSNSR